MRFGSLSDNATRDAVRRDLRVLAAGSFVVGAAAATVYMFGIFGAAVLVAAGVAAVVMHLVLPRASAPSATPDSSLPLHPGIRVDRIPVLGIPGLAFAVGVVVMFWFGAPAYRPVVIGATVGGVIFGVLRIVRRR